MGLFDIFKKKELKVEEIKKAVEEELKLDLEDGIVYSLPDGVLDTTDKRNVETFKHNLKELIKQAKEKGKVDKFKIIRDDDYYPTNGEWKVASKDTCLESIGINLSISLKENIALEKTGLLKKVNGISIPIKEEDRREALRHVPQDLGFVKLPIRYRSTKHFTVNTPLGVTGDHNTVEDERNYTIIDDIDNYLNSGYAYSFSYHDAYLDVAHEPLKLTDNAIVLMEEGRYKELLEKGKLDPDIANRKLILYRGEEYLAIDMVLASLGVLPSRVGSLYAEYDNEINEIIDACMKEVALSNGLLYDKGHFSTKSKTDGHFTSYIDDKNKDYDYSLNEFIEYLKSCFPMYANKITLSSVTTNRSEELIEAIGSNNLLIAINEFNEKAIDRQRQAEEEYNKDHHNIPTNISESFKYTIKRIEYLYESKQIDSLDIPSQVELEDVISHFMHESRVSDQYKYATILNEYLDNIKDVTITSPIEEINGLKM